MDIQTHQNIDYALCGRPVVVEADFCQVEMTTTTAMAVDASGLVHGGFIFGLADHAAMVAVNHPNVVLGAAEVKFLKPVRAGETVVARARIETKEGRKHSAVVQVDRGEERGEETVFKGTFACFVLDQHVLG